ncbi:hypothetical protein MTO96_034591 [Rhipicephalus appendiculatus]
MSMEPFSWQTNCRCSQAPVLASASSERSPAAARASGGSQRRFGESQALSHTPELASPQIYLLAPRARAGPIVSLSRESRARKRCHARTHVHTGALPRARGTYKHLSERMGKGKRYWVVGRRFGERLGPQLEPASR